MKLHVYTAQHIGTRSEQQDVILNAAIPGGHLLIVADGMGGHDNGRQAAVTACRVFPEAFIAARAAHARREDQFIQAFRTAHYAVTQEAPEGGCALTVAYVRLDGEPGVWFAHSGDVLGQLVSRGEVVYKTRPHRMGRHVLAQCLGVRGFDPPECSPSFPFGLEDSILLASDGTYEETGTLRPDAKDPAWAKSVIARAVHHNLGEERDNASLLVGFPHLKAPRRRRKA